MKTRRQKRKTTITEAETREKGFDGLHVGKKDLWMLAGGALGALAFLGLSKASQKVRPAAVGVVKEGYAFKEWVAGKAERSRKMSRISWPKGCTSTRKT